MHKLIIFLHIVPRVINNIMTFRYLTQVTMNYEHVLLIGMEKNEDQNSESTYIEAEGWHFDTHGAWLIVLHMYRDRYIWV